MADPSFETGGGCRTPGVLVLMHRVGLDDSDWTVYDFAWCARPGGMRSADRATGRQADR